MKYTAALVCLALAGCAKEKTMRVQAFASCYDCELSWRDMEGEHGYRLTGGQVVEVVNAEVPEDFDTFIRVCPIEPDTMTNTACWMKRDGEPWGFAWRADTTVLCASVEH